MQNRFKKYMEFSINNKLSLIDSSQFLSYSFDSLVKHLYKDDFKYLIKEFNSNVLDNPRFWQLFFQDYEADWKDLPNGF